MYSDLILNNGQAAKYLRTDDWDRPVYKLESGLKVCCVNMDGTFLHSISPSGEPESPLISDLQPKQ